jgi:hypothetical protein
MYIARAIRPPGMAEVQVLQEQKPATGQTQERLLMPLQFKQGSAAYLSALANVFSVLPSHRSKNILGN